MFVCELLSFPSCSSPRTSGNGFFLLASMEMQGHFRKMIASMAGQPLNGQGLSGLLYAIQGDAEYLQNEFGLKLASHENCCFHCGANRSTRPYNDFRPGASWRGSVISHGDTFKFDILHVLEEGLAAHCIANCAFDFTFRSDWPGSHDFRLKTLFGKISTHYNELGILSEHKIRRFPMSAFCNVKAKWDNFPSLSGLKPSSAGG